MKAKIKESVRFTQDECPPLPTAPLLSMEQGSFVQFVCKRCPSNPLGMSQLVNTPGKITPWARSIHGESVFSEKTNDQTG